MEARRLGDTALGLSVIGLGGMTIGGAFGPVDDAQSLRALHGAIDMNVIDSVNTVPKCEMAVFQGGAATLQMEYNLIKWIVRTHCTWMCRCREEQDVRERSSLKPHFSLSPKPRQTTHLPL